MALATALHQDPFPSIISDNIPIGTPLLVTAIQYPHFLHPVRFHGMYLGEIDLPVEALDPPMLQLLLASGITRIGAGDRVRTAKIFIRELNKWVRGDECVWELKKESA